MFNPILMSGNSSGRMALGFLPMFLPDETLYSLCARFHHLSGNRSAEVTGYQLFGSGAAAMLHDFSTNLEAFILRTHECLGTGDSLAREHTLLKIYLPYQPCSRIKSGIEAMQTGGIDRLKFRLGLPSSRVGATHPLKACKKCIQEELETLGCTYWHLSQQHPAVWMCLRHNELLMQSAGKTKTRNKLQWVLPHTVPHNDWNYLSADIESQFTLLKRLASFSAGVSDLNICFDPQILRQCYLAGMLKFGWLTRCGNVRLKAVREALIDYAIGLTKLPVFSFIQSIDGRRAGFVGKLIESPKRSLHSVKHLLLKIFLFESWSEFLELYVELADAEQSESKKI